MKEKKRLRSWSKNSLMKLCILILIPVCVINVKPPIAGELNQIIPTDLLCPPMECQKTQLHILQIQLMTFIVEVEMNKTLMNQLYEAAKKVEKKTGIPALFQLAQAILESGWDLTPIKNSFNIYGIKYHRGDGKYVEVPTAEYVNGKYVNIMAKFQAYDSFEDCFNDHAELLQKGSYKVALENFKKDGDITKYVDSVSKIYATDPNYARKILSIMGSLREVFGLDYDEEKRQAKDFATRYSLIRPAKAEDWMKATTKEELAVILKRFYELIKKEV